MQQSICFSHQHLQRIAGYRRSGRSLATRSRNCRAGIFSKRSLLNEPMTTNASRALGNSRREHSRLACNRGHQPWPIRRSNSQGVAWRGLADLMLPITVPSSAITGTPLIFCDAKHIQTLCQLQKNCLQTEIHNSRIASAPTILDTPQDQKCK